MTGRSIVPVLAALALSATALAQGQAGGGGSAALDRAKLQEVLTAWSTLDPSKAGAFYAKDAGLAFYDIAPRKYSGWVEYDKGVRDVLKETKSLTLKLGTDAQIHPSGTIAWAAATVKVISETSTAGTQVMVIGSTDFTNADAECSPSMSTVKFAANSLVVFLLSAGFLPGDEP